MNFSQVQYVLAVARYRNFSKAAESLFLSQPALSQQIKKLEEELGFSLFTRMAQGVALTSEGKAFFDSACRVEEAWNQLQETAARGRRYGRPLRVSLGTRVYSNDLFEPIMSFFDRHPEFEVCFFTEPDGDFLASLRKGSLDVALDRLPLTYFSSGHKRFYSCELIPERQCVLASLQDPVYTMSEIPFALLDGCTLISPMENTMTDLAIRQRFREYGISFGKVFRSDRIETIMNMVKRGKGITMGPLSFADYYGVRAIPLIPATYLSLNFICLRERKDSFELSLFRDFLVQLCKKPISPLS
ncbi:MAG: LysR family transcriptional regulator [Lachnospiraceae bacterium]|jgi:DNA-binding transcriptional LysR family regulator|nr:LysR family transcriptional regulator [Lachnospiraceae bacterium]